jgi:hypothetical protein
MRRMTGVSVALALTVGAFTATACGGDGDEAGSPLGGPKPPSSEGVAAGTESASATGTAVEAARVTVGESVHYAGFVFELGDAALAPSETAVDIEGNPDPTIGQLTIDAVIENVGADDAAPDQSQMYIEQGGTPLDLDPYNFEGLPVIPGGSTGNAEIVFDGLPSDFDLENAELVFGDGTLNQARVPLGGEGETVTLAPLDITPGAAGQAGELTITVTSGQLHYGDTYNHWQEAAGDGLLVVEFTLTVGAGLDQPGGTFFGGEHIRLILPDGTSLATAGDGVSSPGEILDGSATFEGLVARFEVPTDLRGSFQLALRGRFGTTDNSGANADAEGMATFELTD